MSYKNSQSAHARILVVEPYYDGSHRHFLQGLRGNIDAEFVFLTLPARKWKLRMQFAAFWVVSELKKLPVGKRFFDVLLASTFVDLATLRMLLISLDGWNKQCRFLLYFHENQFAYPMQFTDSSRFQFAAINFNSAVAADSIAFNSQYNRSSFLEGSRRILKKATAEMPFGSLAAEIEAKSCILFPGIDLQKILEEKRKKKPERAVIVWNHRWEGDKNPQDFLNALLFLQKEGACFSLILLGQKFAHTPSCFDGVERRFSGNLLHCGFVENYAEYVRLLGRGTLVVSTAHHEFYGISVIEAVRAGCVPLLPNRLSYPELFPARFLYDEKELEQRLLAHCCNPVNLDTDTARKITERFDWQALADSYRRWILG